MILSTAPCRAVFSDIKYFILVLWHKWLNVLLLRCINQIKGPNLILSRCQDERENDTSVHSQPTQNVFTVNNMCLSQSHYFGVHKVGCCTSDNSVGSPHIYIYIFVIAWKRENIKFILNSHHKQLKSTVFQGQFTAFW